MSVCRRVSPTRSVPFCTAHDIRQSLEAVQRVALSFEKSVHQIHLQYHIGQVKSFDKDVDESDIAGGIWQIQESKKPMGSDFLPIQTSMKPQRILEMSGQTFDVESLCVWFHISRVCSNGNDVLYLDSLKDQWDIQIKRKLKRIEFSSNKNRFREPECPAK